MAKGTLTGIVAALTMLAAAAAAQGMPPICQLMTVPPRGVYALFAGPQRNEKIEAARALAETMGLELYRVDLSQAVAKYIGETEKNLTRLFDRAPQTDAVLFLDEGDALLGRRTDVTDSHDRYASVETAYLLKRIEAYEGIAILATNLRTEEIPSIGKRPFIVDFSPGRPRPREQLKGCR